MWTGVPYRWWLCNLPGIVSWQLLSEHQVSFCYSLAPNCRIEGSAKRCGELELQKELEPSAPLRSCFILKAFKDLGCLKNLVYLRGGLVLSPCSFALHWLFAECFGYHSFLCTLCRKPSTLNRAAHFSKWKRVFKHREKLFEWTSSLYPN